MEPADLGATAEISEGDGSVPRRRSVVVQEVGSGIRAYTPTLWQARLRRQEGEKPKPERDSLRSRSNEGRPGSRKHQRFSRSQEVLSSFRRTLNSLNVDLNEADLNALIKDANKIEHRPSAFCHLMQREGPERALEVWAAAEAAAAARRPRSRPRRPQSDAQVTQEHRRSARIAFGDNWNYIRTAEKAKDLLQKLEEVSVEAFGSSSSSSSSFPPPESEADWVLTWDPDASTFHSFSGSAPASRIVLAGLDAAGRRFVHQFAKWMGLHSQSEGPSCGLTVASEKTLVLWPPLPPSKAAWTAPFSVSRVISE
mmetsp:Transcript_89735/g.187461  ORF Transcript_89735/g.187461 Transcript_89735/m.187461 type:complete len:311 (-) Transcript_89735:39-971(-)|eukprot:CAMPEP_0206476254 /NCGR_PEP_ID=MMETSP0324_2-20121206/34608_1 /ASSEMBLY_ACC=CAM_ASM_000836 /TAXON_ID=2866 /ORGANISM="Crypthecodinium cohnii, Strain Seligo" /LENGTH=310 /DNA_ID=CAMNT_0053951853 /DNA_START=108 /DNA_END=1037 /DNA_ORIENTATION=+